MTSSRISQPSQRGIGRMELVAFGLILGIGIVAGGLLWPRKPQVAFVRTNEVIARYKGAVQARESFKRDTAAWQEEAKQLEKELQDLIRTAKPKDEKALGRGRELRSRLEALRDKGAQRDQELMAPVLAEVNAGIKKYAQKNGYKLILGTLQGGVVLHGDESCDVTESLLQDLNR